MYLCLSHYCSTDEFINVEILSSCPRSKVRCKCGFLIYRMLHLNVHMDNRDLAMANLGSKQRLVIYVAMLCLWNRIQIDIAIGYSCTHKCHPQPTLQQERGMMRLPVASSAALLFPIAFCSHLHQIA